ncbi:MAG: glycosyltransferase family 4 protein [Alphaproteobacteria bacterium]|nr:glycosyltransferase family 4 protein [Alphaproteobacteria bacterium]
MDFKLIAAVVVTFMLSWFLTHVTRKFLLRKAILDHPNERSSHTVATPRGGGLAIAALLIPLWCAFAIFLENYWLLLPAAAALILASVSFLDDIISLSPAKRLILQLAACFVGFYWIHLEGGLSQGLIPIWLEWMIFPLIWAGFVNFYNFMDGIDGITSVETITIGMGVFTLSLLAPDLGIFYQIGIFIAAIMFGFLMLNWHPAKIFLGDVGSITLGYLLGGCLLLLAAQGYWAAAIILPLYYLCDAGLTLSKRALRGEKIWLAHKQHFYQKATQRGQSHARVSTAIALCNITMVAFAVISLYQPIYALLLSFLSVAILLIWMRKS